MQEDMISRASNEEERIADRYDRLEEHLNDFVELTQNELTNLKQEISNMEEKIDYQLDERTRDLQEALEHATTRVRRRRQLVVLMQWLPMPLIVVGDMTRDHQWRL